MDHAVAGRHVREAPGEAGGLGAWARSGRVAATWSQYAGQSAELVGERVEEQPGRSRRQLAGDHLEGVEPGVQVGLTPGPARRTRLDVLDAEHDPLAVLHPQQAGRGDRRRQGGQLAGLLAVGLREHPLGLRRRRLHEVLRAVGTREHRGEARRESAGLGHGVDDGRAAVSLDERAHGRRQVRPGQALGGPSVRDRRGDGGHPLILHDDPRTGYGVSSRTCSR